MARGFKFPTAEARVLGAAACSTPAAAAACCCRPSPGSSRSRRWRRVSAEGCAGARGRRRPRLDRRCSCARCRSTLVGGVSRRAVDPARRCQRGGGDRDHERRAAAAGARRRPRAGVLHPAGARRREDTARASAVWSRRRTLAPRSAASAACCSPPASCARCSAGRAAGRSLGSTNRARYARARFFALSMTALVDLLVFGAPVRRPDDGGRSGANAGGRWRGIAPRRRTPGLAAA